MFTSIKYTNKANTPPKEITNINIINILVKYFIYRSRIYWNSKKVKNTKGIKFAKTFISSYIAANTLEVIIDKYQI
jgi:hypothetical protein